MNNEIQRAVNNYKKVIHSQNKEDFYRLWSKEDCSLISISNQFFGVDEIYNDFLIGTIQAKFAKIDLVQDGDLTISQPNENMAVVIFRYHTECILRELNAVYGISGVETQVMVREDDQWKLLHVHYSR